VVAEKAEGTAAQTEQEHYTISFYDKRAACRLDVRRSLIGFQTLLLVMGDSAKKKTIRFDSIRFIASKKPTLSRKHHARIISLTKSAKHPSDNWFINKSIIIAFAEASGDIGATVYHDAILQHSDARS